MRVSISKQAFDPWQWLAAYQAELIREGHLSATGFGATDVFVGTMRDFNEGDAVSSMVLEHYPGMTEHQLEQLLEHAFTEHDILEATIHHRVGEIHPSEPIVLVAVWAAHRKDAFAACRSLMEALKSTAPFWKKEITAEGQRWVEKNTAG